MLSEDSQKSRPDDGVFSRTGQEEVLSRRPTLKAIDLAEMNQPWRRYRATRHSYRGMLIVVVNVEQLLRSCGRH